MPKRSSKRPKDTNRLAKHIVSLATGEVDDPLLAPEDEGKNPAAVALGRLGGLKGGKARAASLSRSQRSKIARRAAIARWKKNDG